LEIKKTVLIVDDEKHTRDGLRAALEEHYEVYVAGDAAGAMTTLDADPADVVITDLKIGTDDGMELMEKILKRSSPPICIMMTAYGSVDTAVEAMRRGAYDFVTKPVNIDRLEMLVRRALREREVQAENVELRREVVKARTPDKMIGRSPVMERVFDTIRQVAPSKATVLIQGESGTGKEVAAKAIHSLSTRAEKPFVAVHCAALSPQLLESELFGHEKGAFTGASERRIGRFEQAAGGTLFLDEIGEIDPSVQVKILRVLGEKNFERVGGNRTIDSNVRLLAATNKDLAAMVAAGTFREDLFFRLNVVPLTMPPLRDHREDIPLLADAFLKEMAKEHGKPPRRFTPEAMSTLESYGWPGNIRELRAAVEHAVVLGVGTELEINDLPTALRSLGSIRPDGSESSDSSKTSKPFGEGALNLAQVESVMIRKALEECGENRTLAAKKLGISRRTLHRHLAQIGITKHAS
jgi:DNA-binding NtrC family response regulator